MSILNMNANVFDTGDSGIPSGGIIIWSGSVDTIPDGWALCNGENGTPDLSSQFILGTGGDYQMCYIMSI